MQRVVQLEVKDGELSLSRDMLREASLEDAVAAVVREHLILLKPLSLSARMRGVAKKRLSYRELEELYAQRTN
ncbi:MAG: hypothetical protein DRI80_18015 [Chloroflexota bacterium]|nr:MAG: hypothetical protein DRI80_18015 [Chloroflexota bacterium]